MIWRTVGTEPFTCSWAIEAARTISLPAGENFNPAPNVL